MTARIVRGSGRRRARRVARRRARRRAGKGASGGGGRKLIFIAVPKNASTTIRKLGNLQTGPEHRLGTESYPEGARTVAVVRDPAARFCSAVSYGLASWGSTPRLIKKGLTTPSVWISAMRDKTHPCHELVWKEIRQPDSPPHTVDGRPCTNTWTMEKQITWLKNPARYLLRFEYLEQDWEKLRKSCPSLPKIAEHRNASKAAHSLTPAEEEYVRGVYPEDTELWRSASEELPWPPPSGSVLYINLAHRLDRKREIEAELQKVGWPIERLAATKKNRGAIGCSISHARALEELYRRGHPYGIVLEDDAVLEPRANAALPRALRETFFDVFLLGTNRAKSVPGPAGFRRVLGSQTTTGYLVTRAFMPVLIRCFRESARKLAAGAPGSRWCGDKAWQELMKDDVFLACDRPLAFQRESYSDIARKKVRYESCRRRL